MCGAIAISFCLAHINPAPIVLAAFTVLFAWLSYGLLNVNYALFSMAITGYIVFLLSLNQVPGPTIALHRTVATALGGAIALSHRRDRDLVPAPPLAARGRSGASRSLSATFFVAPDAISATERSYLRR